MSSAGRTHLFFAAKKTPYKNPGKNSPLSAVPSLYPSKGENLMERNFINSPLRSLYKPLHTAHFLYGSDLRQKVRKKFIFFQITP